MLPTLDPSVNLTLIILMAVALVILALSCVNFVNLSLARSAQRGMEVAIRKTAGASRAALIVQFLGESVLQVFLALIVAAAIVEWVRPALEAFIPNATVVDYWREPKLILAIVCGAAVIGVVAGAYPALILSRFRPAAVLKGWVTESLKRGWLHAVLVAFQFSGMIFFLICSGVFFLQNDYAQTDPRHVPTGDTLLMNIPSCGSPLETQIAALPGVRAVACSSIGPFGDGLSVGGKRKDRQIIQLKLSPVGLHYFEFYGMKPLAGRFFRASSGDEATASLAHIVIDQTAVRQLGFGTPQAAIGQSVDFQSQHRVVVGVVRNFFLAPPISSDDQLHPTIYTLGHIAPLQFGLNVRLDAARIPETLGAIDGLWRRSYPNTGISRAFLDEFVQTVQLNNQRETGMAAGFSGLAMLLACLGLFGISLLTAEARTKEIGVRKAMGARDRDILGLMLWRFAKPVLWANLAAWPIAFWAMSSWLSGFAYHLAMPLWLFPAVGTATLMVALLTVLGQALMVARRKPVLALRYE